MKKNRLDLVDFVVLEAVDMSSSESQLNAYVDSLYRTLAKMSTLTFQLQNYTATDKDAFRARNSSPLINNLHEIYIYFTQKLQHKFITLIEYNLEGFKKVLYLFLNMLGILWKIKRLVVNIPQVQLILLQHKKFLQKIYWSRIKS